MKSETTWLVVFCWDKPIQGKDEGEDEVEV